MAKQQKKANKNHKLILGLKQLLAEVNTDLTMMPADGVECQIELINQAHLIHTEYKKVVDAWLLDTSVKDIAEKAEELRRQGKTADMFKTMFGQD